MFSNLSLKHRLYLSSFFTIIFFIAVMLFSMREIYEQEYEHHREEISNAIDLSEDLVTQAIEQEKKGIFSHEAAMDEAKKRIQSIRYGDKNYIFLLETSGKMVMHPTKPSLDGNSVLEIKDPTGKYPYKEMLAIIEKDKQGYLSYMWPKPGEEKFVNKISFVKLIPEWNWVIGTGAYTDDIEERLQQRLYHYLALASVLVSLILTSSYLLGRSVIKQIGGEPSLASQLMKQAHDGYLNVTDNFKFEQNDSVLNSLAKMLHQLRTMIQEIGSSSKNLKLTANTIHTHTQAVQQATELESNESASMAAAIEQMAASIMQVSSIAKETERSSREASKNANEGEVRVKAAMEEMQGISGTVGDAAQKIQALVVRTNEISAITGVIKGIAEQTNLLALNAAIEAARAGEMGRGFAVVADEVRSLAARTATATVQIEDMIRGTQLDTQAAVSAMELARPQVMHGVELAISAAEALRQIKIGSEENLRRIKEVAEATLEQSAAGTNISNIVNSFSAKIDTTHNAMDETMRSVVELEHLSDELSSLIARFHC